MRGIDENLINRVRDDLRALAAGLHSGETIPLPTISSLPRYANESGPAMFNRDLQRIIDEHLPEDLRRAARAIFAVFDARDSAISLRDVVPPLTSRERAIADNGTARRWMRHAVLTDTATRVALLAAPALLTRHSEEHFSSFYIGHYGVHVDHEMTLAGERCRSMSLNFFLSPNDKSRCFDWRLPLSSIAEAGSCIVLDEAGAPLPWGIVDDRAQPVLLVCFGASFEDEWRRISASIELRGGAEHLRALTYDHGIRRQQHYVRTVRLSTGFANLERSRTIGYHKSPHAWRPSRPERAVLEPGVPAVLEFNPFGANDYTLVWD